MNGLKGRRFSNWMRLRLPSLRTEKSCTRLLGGILAFVLLVANHDSQSLGQRVRFAQSTPVPSMSYPNTAPAPIYGGSSIPGGAYGNGGYAPAYPPNNMIPLGGSYQNGISAPAFDPYAPTVRPSTVGVLPSGSSTGWPNWFGNQNSPVVPNSFPNNYPSSVYPNANPPALFPGYSSGNGWGSGGPTWGQSGWNQGSYNNGWNGQSQGGLFGNWTTPNPYGNPNGYGGNGWYNSNPSGPLFNGGMPQPMRFFVGPRFRHSWVQADDDPTSLETNDSDVSLVFAVPNFFGSTQPLFIVPSFSMHTFEGPRLATADIPGNAYSGFLDVGWESDPMRTFGLELGVRTGVFSDFDTFNSDSFRVMGKALGRVRLTPNATLRGGVYYIDRNRYKLVPAGGILWVPNPDTRFDIFFPEPKLAHYLNTVGNTDFWWYILGYYGGGTWTVTRASGNEESIDINEMRLALGLEFGKNDMIRQGRRLGFIEGGYAFKRELLFKSRPQDNTDLEDGWVVRAGVGY